MSAGEGEAAGRGRKSPSAFRTTSEVAGELQLPPHVLRFWESKFGELKPVKRGGGRRYYRPEDIALLARIKERLYRDGYTIRGVQKLLREEALAEKAQPARSIPLRGIPPGETCAAPAPKGNAARSQERPSAALLRARLEEVRGELLAIRALLQRVLEGEE